MPLQTAKSLMYDVYQLLMIDISLSGGLQAIVYSIVGTLSPLQAIVLGLNAILIIARVTKIFINWKSKSNKDG